MRVPCGSQKALPGDKSWNMTKSCWTMMRRWSRSLACQDYCWLMLFGKREREKGLPVSDTFHAKRGRPTKFDQQRQNMDGSSGESADVSVVKMTFLEPCVPIMRFVLCHHGYPTVDIHTPTHTALVTKYLRRYSPFLDFLATP
jgi:hypothetical protein